MSAPSIAQKHKQKPVTWFPVFNWDPQKKKMLESNPGVYYFFTNIFIRMNVTTPTKEMSCCHYNKCGL